MPFIVLIIGVLIVVVAWNETHHELAAALKQDLPPFLKWGGAIALILSIGFVPGLEKISRWLLAIVFLVIFLTKWEAIKAGLAQFVQVAPSDTAAGGSPSTPASTLASNPAGQTTTPAVPQAPVTTVNPFDPQTYINAFEPSPSAGFGGLSQ